MVGSGSSGGGGEEGFTGRAAIGYDHGYDGEVFYLGLALDERYVEGWVEGCLERTTPRRSYSSVTCGMRRPRGRW
jgi:hypothetical protein